MSIIKFHCSCCYYCYIFFCIILIFAFVFGTAYAASDCASSLAAFRVGAAPFLQGHVIMFSGTISFPSFFVHVMFLVIFDVYVPISAILLSVYAD